MRPHLLRTLTFALGYVLASPPAAAAPKGKVPAAAQLTAKKGRFGNIHNDGVVNKHGVSTIRFRRTGCLGSCPAFSMTLHRGGKASYTGHAHVERMGKRTGTIHRRRFDRLASLLIRGGFFRLLKRYRLPITCQPSAIIEAKQRGVWKRVEDYGGAGPVLLWAMHQTLDRVVESIQWKVPGARPLTRAARRRLSKRLLAKLQRLNGPKVLVRDRFLEGRASRTLRSIRHRRPFHGMLQLDNHDGAAVQVGGCSSKPLTLLGYDTFPRGHSRVGLALDSGADGKVCALIFLR